MSVKELSMGDQAPTFEGKTYDGQTISNQTLAGKPYVLYFYPKDDTPGCTAEACSFRDHKQHFDTHQANLIGISPDPANSHQKFIEKYGLNFTLLSDPDHKICEKFGVWQEKMHFGKKTMGVVRTTFVVDEQGIIRWIECPVQVEGHTERVLEALQHI